ncbi:hypothetical protein AWV79_03170 [Cupriavidus sp. UYMMa02A]|nr:hypothetical protein AWV79_03170 [Cupriavidus sp. UYMMa02A]
MVLHVLAWLMWPSSAAWCATAVDIPAGNLPLAYLPQNGIYPWTGRLRALGWNPLAPAPDPASHASLWEAGARLDAKSAASRHLYTSIAPAGMDAERLVSLQWSALDAASQQAVVQGTATGVSGPDRLAWLRGDLGNTALRPRETRMANARGARVLVVPPPVWQPGKAGHGAFRDRYRTRPHMVWLGTTDALLHGFSAITGEEFVGYLPRTLLSQAAIMTDPKGALAPVPCPRPEAADVVLHREWRTVLLCGIPAMGGDHGTPGVFALDITDPADPAPVRLLWEMTATTALALSARGPVRAAAFASDAGPRWFAVTTLEARADGAGSRPGLALIPLERPADSPALTWLLPERDCTGAATTSALAGVSILSDMAGMALAIYATDDSGQLWHFPLADAARRPAQRTPTCRHKLPVAGKPDDRAEPPLLVGGSASPLVVFGQGSEVAAISTRAGGIPTRIVAEPAGAGSCCAPCPDETAQRPERAGT